MGWHEGMNDAPPSWIKDTATSVEPAYEVTKVVGAKDVMYGKMHTLLCDVWAREVSVDDALEAIEDLLFEAGH